MIKVLAFFSYRNSCSAFCSCPGGSSDFGELHCFLSLKLSVVSAKIFTLVSLSKGSISSSSTAQVKSHYILLTLSVYFVALIFIPSVISFLDLVSVNLIIFILFSENLQSQYSSLVMYAQSMFAMSFGRNCFLFHQVLLLPSQ